jgi:DNA-binding transcriptional LysR family regulator
MHVEISVWVPLELAGRFRLSTASPELWCQDMHWTDRIGRRLNPRDLHIFMVAVERGNMARAAEALAISRPVVSRTIADLEQSLGVRLLDRNPQGIEPTLFGRALLKRSIAVFDELRQGIKDVEFLSDPNSGEVGIGCTEPMAAGFVAAIIDRLSEQYPQFVFQLELCTTPAQQLHVLRERKCDLVISRRWTHAVEPDMEVEILLDEHWLLAPVDNEPGSPVFEIFRAIGAAVPRARVLSYSLNVRNSLLASGRFLAIVPNSVLQFGIGHLLLNVLPCELPPSVQPVAVTTRRDRMLSPAARLFIECAREVAGTLPKIKSNGARKPRAKT